MAVFRRLPLLWSCSRFTKRDFHASKNTKNKFDTYQPAGSTNGLREEKAGGEAAADLNYETSPLQAIPQFEDDTEQLIVLQNRPAKSKRLLEKGVRAMEEIDRLRAYTDSMDPRLLPKFEDVRQSLQLAIAADVTNGDALLALARFHLCHEGPALSPEVGLSLLRHVANAGLAEAQYDLCCYLRQQADEGDEESKRASHAYLKKAAEQNHTEALFLLGLSLCSGDIVQRNFAEAERCLLAAAQQGHAGAATLYGALLAQATPPASSTTEGEREERKYLAREWLEAAAAAGEQLAFQWLRAAGAAPPPAEGGGGVLYVCRGWNGGTNFTEMKLHYANCGSFVQCGVVAESILYSHLRSQPFF